MSTNAATGPIPNPQWVRRVKFAVRGTLLALPLYVLIFLLLTASFGCTSTQVTAADVELLKTGRDNVQAMNDRLNDYERFLAVKANGETTDATAWIKGWWAADLTSWEALVAWAQGVAPATKSAE